MPKNKRQFLRALGKGILCILLSSVQLYGGQASSWIEGNLAPVYFSVKQELLTVLSDAEARKVPAEILFEKIREGTAKGIEPGLLLSAVQQEESTLVLAQKLLRTADMFSKIQDQAKITELYKNISVFLHTGLSEKMLGNFLEKSIYSPEPDRTFTTISSTMQKVKAMTRLSDEKIQLLGTAILTGNWNRTSYTALPALFTKAKLKNISEDQLTEIIIRLVPKKLGILQIDEEINRRERN